jgi:hypothetical protein
VSRIFGTGRLLRYVKKISGSDLGSQNLSGCPGGFVPETYRPGKIRRAMSCPTFPENECQSDVSSIYQPGSKTAFTIDRSEKCPLRSVATWSAQRFGPMRLRGFLLAMTGAWQECIQGG